MKAIVHSGMVGLQGLKIDDIQEKHPQAGEVKVALKSAGLNRRDITVLQRRQDVVAPLIPGSDGAGIITEVGDGVAHISIGDEVIINPSLHWLNAGNVPEQIEILGSPKDGTFAQSVILPAENVETKPAYLTWQEAGVLSVAALTAYRALFTRGQVKAGEYIFLPGIGSGVATYVLPMAKAIGAQVIVTSRSAEKRQRALEMGADIALDSNENWDEALQGKRVDLIIESIGAATFQRSLSLLRAGGRIVNFGATTGDEVQLSLRTFFFQQWSLLSTSMGSREEFRDMLAFIERHQIRPVIDTMYPLDEALLAFQKMEEGTQFGKIGLLI